MTQHTDVMAQQLQPAPATDRPVRGPRWCPDPDDASRLRWWDGWQWGDAVAVRAGDAWETTTEPPSWNGPLGDRQGRGGRRVGKVLAISGAVLFGLFVAGGLTLAWLEDDDVISSRDVQSLSRFDVAFVSAILLCYILPTLGVAIYLASPPARVSGRQLANRSMGLALFSLSLFGIVVSPVLIVLAIVTAVRARRRARDPDGRDRRRANIALGVAIACTLLVVPMWAMWNAFGEAT